MPVSIIIKAFNEERHVARAIESALAALAPAAGEDGGEVILADGGSTDRTLAIAARYPIRVVRLAHACDRGCGAGPQLGYQHARGDTLCLIDGDMVLDPAFIHRALALLAAHPRVAGVGGLLREVNVVNLEFERRQKRGARDLEPGPVDRLNGGGLYRRAAIEAVGYFSDRNLHGYEEYDLAARLRAAGWTLHRLPVAFVDHHGHVMGGYRLLWRRLRTGYLFGIGEVLRAALGRPHLALLSADLPEIRLWCGVYVGWSAALAVALAAPLAVAAPLLAAMAALPVAALGFRYRSVRLGLYAFVAWNAHALGMAVGFLRPRVPPLRPLASVALDAAARVQAPEGKASFDGAAAPDRRGMRGQNPGQEVSHV